MPKVISEDVKQTCRFAWKCGSVAPPVWKLLPVSALLAFAASTFTLCAGQGAGAGLYTVPNNAFIENPAGDSAVVTIFDASASIASLQTSIDNARSANPDAILVIHLLSGATYSVTNAGLTLGARECLIASGATIQASSAAVTVPLLQIASGATNVSVAGGTFDGNGANIQGIYAQAAARVNIDAVIVRNCGQDCILLKGNGNSTYDNEITVARCDTSGSPLHAGISIQNATQAVCIDNYCHNNLAGIYLNCAWANVANNFCSANTTGIDVAGGNDNAVANNTCTNNATGIHAGGSNHMIVSNVTGDNSTSGINSNGSSTTFIDNLFTAGNAVDFSSAGSGNRVVAYRKPLSAAGQNYFYPPLIDDQHTNTTIVNGMGRTDLTIGSTTIDSLQTQYDAARAANPTNVIVLHLNGTFTVGATPLLLSSNTCVLLSGAIQINGSTTATSAISDNNSPARVSISGGVIDGGNLTGNNGIQFSSSSMLQVDAMTLQNFGPANPRTGGSDVIHFDHGSTPYIVTRCTVNGGSARGIWLQLSGVKSLVSDNDVSNVNQDGVDCDSSTSGCVAKFNNCHDLVRYGVFFEQSASHNLALGNLCARTGRGINVYNNDVNPRAATQYNTSVCNRCDANSNGLRNGSTGNTNTLSSHNFAFNNVVINNSSIGIEGDPDGVENYYSQNYLSGNGTAITTSGSETFFNPPDVTASFPSGANLSWNSISSGAWDTNALNWLDLSNSLPSAFHNGDNARFTDAPGVQTNITIASGVLLQPGTVTVDADTNQFTISGAGRLGGSTTLLKDGASTLTLSTSNDFNGTVTVLDGTLRAGNASALGSSAGATFVAGGALDVNGFNLGGEPVTASGSGPDGNGAIVNRGATQTSALRTVTLAGDTTFGGTGRWDIRNTGGTASLFTGGQAFRITKTGANQVSLVGVNPIDAALGDIDIQQGVLAIQTTTTQLGDANKSIFVRNGATLNLWNLNTIALNKKIVLENGATLWNESGNSLIVGVITLTNGMATFNIGGTSLTMSNNVLSGPGGLNKIGAGVLTLSGGNTFTGSTLISTGTLALVNSGSIANCSMVSIAGGAVLDVSGRIDGKFMLSAGQTLAGNGTLNGSLTIGPGATLSPGTSIGALWITNSVSLQGTTLLELNKASNTNDVIRAASIVCGGTLSLTNLNGTLSAGDHFKIFYATCTGMFTNFVPPMAGSGLVWDTSTLIDDGTLRVSMAPQPQITTIVVSNGDLVFSGTNGVPRAPYFVLTATNVALPVGQWTRLATNAFGSNGEFLFSMPPDGGQRFYRLQLP